MTPEEASAGEKTGEVATRTGQATRDVFGYEQERRGLASSTSIRVPPTRFCPSSSTNLPWCFQSTRAVTTTMSVFIPGSIAITATRMVSNWV